MVTGLDLVEWQLRVAAGEQLDMGALEPKGHAIEFRINAEDPYNNFLPSPGQIVDWQEPAGPGVRVDSWVRPGTTITQYYDNLMAKLVVWAPNRQSAIARGKRALSEFEVSGVSTTIPAHLAVLEHDDFVQGKHHTKWMEETVPLADHDPEFAPALPEDEAMAKKDITVEVGGKRFRVTYWAPEPGTGGLRRRAPKLTRSGPAAASDGVVTAPMQGTIVKVQARAGKPIKTGEPVCVLEAMKMENEVVAPNDGEVVDLRVEPGDTVTAGQVIA